MFYAAERSGALLPKAGLDRVRALEWFFFFVTDVIAPNNQGTMLTTFVDSPEKVVDVGRAFDQTGA